MATTIICKSLVIFAAVTLIACLRYYQMCGEDLFDIPEDAGDCPVNLCLMWTSIGSASGVVVGVLLWIAQIIFIESWL